LGGDFLLSAEKTVHAIQTRINKIIPSIIYLFIYLFIFFLSKRIENIETEIKTANPFETDGNALGTLDEN